MQMANRIETLTLGTANIGHGRIVQTGDPGGIVNIPIFGFLILGGPEVVLVDTGFRNPDILKRLSMTGFRDPEHELDAQLKNHGVARADVRYVVQTHLHIDHAGQLDQFARSTAVMSRRELEYSVSGLSGPSYPPEDIKHIIDRLHRKDELWLLDLEGGRFEEVIPGVRCEEAGGHTEGSINVWVDTNDGLACICGDIIYRVDEQLFSNKGTLLNDPIISGNTVVTRRSEKSSIKNALSRATVMYPSHDRNFRVQNGRPIHA
jgi:glyoxylase-like metal-dependent hydrolase (beta-lactamase superfamily II)